MGKDGSYNWRNAYTLLLTVNWSALWSRSRRKRRHLPIAFLDGMNDHTLRDIGLTRTGHRYRER
ncbi:MAG: hypothetical protein ACTS3R_06250 [Inquilinaceae bacterium]